MKRSEQVLFAMNGIGDDLVVMAEQQSFPRSPWQRLLPVAACVALILGAAAALRQLPAAPVQPEPPAQEFVLETPAAEETILEPEVTYTIEEEAEKPKPFTRELNTQAFYIFDPDPGTDETSSKAIAPDGTVLFETADGQIEPLIDHLTGEYIAITVCRRTVGTSLAGYTYDIYTLDGKQVVTGMAAYDIDCLGNVILVLESDGTNYRASVFRRDSYELLRNDFRTGMIVGDCIWLTPQDGDGTVQYLMDGDGNLTVVETLVDSYFVWQDRAYFVTGQGGECLGLMDSKGKQLIEGKYAKVCYGISNGYARCEDENGHYLVDITTGEEVFRWDYPILDAFENHLLLHTEDYHYALADWNGYILATGISIQPIDDENDGDPELFVVAQNDSTVYLNPAGDVLVVTPADRSIVENYITSRTVITYQYLDEDHHEIYRIDLTTGERTRMDQTYTTISPIWEDDQATGLFYAAQVEITGEIGDVRCDIVREDGTVLLSGLDDLWTRQGDVFYTEDENTRGLIRLDGTWLYQEPND